MISDKMPPPDEELRAKAVAEILDDTKRAAARAEVSNIK